MVIRESGVEWALGKSGEQVGEAVKGELSWSDSELCE